MPFSIIDLSAVAGLIALVLLTLNFLLGFLLVTAYKKTAVWKKLPGTLRRVSVAKVHNWTAYCAFAIILLHPLLLTLQPSTKFTLRAIFLPLQAPVQPAFVLLGVLSLYALVLVVLTSQKGLRKQMGYRIWKNIHLISYATAVTVCIHGIFLDPELKNREPDFLDGEKLVCEICLLVLIVGMILRLRYYKRKPSFTKRTTVKVIP